MKKASTQRSQLPKDLGKETNRFKQRIPLNWWALLFLSILGVVLVWYWFSMSALAEGLAHGTVSATRVIIWGMGGMLAFIVVMVISLIGLITYPRFSLIIYEQGFSYETKNAFICASWEEITGLQMDFQRIWWLIFLIKRTNLTIHLFNGNSLMINHYMQHIDQVKALFEKQVFPIVMERMRAGYNQGAVLPFGPILLSKANGMKFENTMIRWESIHSMTVDGGTLTFKYYMVGGALETARCQIKDIINLSVLLTLIKESLKPESD
jgi:hypothetical protein